MSRGGEHGAAVSPRSSPGLEKPSALAWHATLLQSRWFILAVLFVARTVIAFRFQSVAALGPVLVQDLALDYARLVRAGPGSGPPTCRSSYEGGAASP